MSDENQVSPLMGEKNEAETTPEVETTEEAQEESQAEPEVEAEVEVEEPEVAAQPPEVNPTAHTPQVEVPVEDDKVRYEKRAHKMKEVLQSQPQVSFMIPLGIGERKGAYDTVQINGYKLTIMKGTMVKLPQQVVDLLAAKYEVEMSAGADARIDGDQNRADALTG